MTVWDVLYKYIDKGLSWTLLFAAIVLIIWLLSHPQAVREWNTQITVWIAAFAPKKRKKAFEKRLCMTVDAAKLKFDEAAPPALKKFLPYDLKVEWISEEETTDSFFKDNQVVVYVNSYKDEVKQAVGVLHNYCAKGFGQNAKMYMPASVCKSSDLIVTQKLAQYAGRNIYDYFNREYIPEQLKADKTFVAVFNKLRKVDTDGLFLPVLFNEIDKYASRVFPAPPSDEVFKTIVHFMDFIYGIASHTLGDDTKLTFCENGIKVRVILAISDSACSNIQAPVEVAQKTINEKSIDTLYVLATGSKIRFAEEIANTVYCRNPQEVFEPIKTEYKRYTRHPFGSDAVCFEINLR